MGAARDSTLPRDLRDEVLAVPLNRPARPNAFTTAMAEEPIDVYESANSDDEVRAIVVTEACPTFCAGTDLRGTGNVFGLD
ncbi:enoyl-CoA hydratase/carnithine racemase [Amycolatopsis jiangsuensis]|uniref:Enoyl-CoA hydratase/carnithine racemase n=1 Tax=Amycolatopsis jiangsuensis TaxID=1181879 RepID=A0A840J3M0_9PSEU|nr:enoyl-CoA hydratase/carnithine racemase [Amycolatopsis jiangsuensis]